MEQEYLNLLRDVMDNGNDRGDRTSTGTRSVFGRQMRFNMAEGFPLLTTKKVHWAAVVHELLWFIAGDTNVKYLQDNGVRIWNEWADENGDLGPVYGHQWRTWPTKDGGHIDQLAGVVRDIRHNPESRRHIVTAWNPEDIPNMALPPCHTLYQFYVDGEYLSLQLYQRSGDLFLGVPFNIASYALLLELVAHVTGYRAGEFVHTLGDAHVYLNHFDQVRTQLERDVRTSPKISLTQDIASVFDFTFGDIFLHNYDPHPAIKGKVSV